MTGISPTVLIDEWLPVSPPAANATAAASCAKGSIQIVASHPAAFASGLSSPPAKAADTGGSGATARKRRREALAGAGKQPKRARGKKEKAPLTESTAATGGEWKQVDALTASTSDSCDQLESAPSSPTVPAFPRGGDSASLAAQTLAPMNLDTSARANRGAKQKADVAVRQPLAKKLLQRRSLLPSPAPIFRQTLGELWSFLDPTFSTSEPASSLEQPTKSGPSQSFSLGQEATTSESPTPSAQSCLQRCPTDAAVAATDAAGANAAGSEGGARSICGRTSAGSADAEEGSLDTVISGGKRGASKTASVPASARARSDGGATTARQVAVLREAVAAAHSAGRAVVAPAGSSAADGGASMGQQGAGDGGKRRARRPFSRQGSSNAPHVAARDGKAAGARGAQRDGADGAEVARGEAAMPGRPLGSAAAPASASAAVPPPAVADLSASHDNVSASHADVSAFQVDVSGCEGGAPPCSHAPAPLASSPTRPASPPSPAPSLPPAAPSLPSPISPPQPRPHMDGSSSKSLLTELSLESPSLGPQGPSFESHLYESPNWSGSPDLSLQAHSMQSLWTDEGTSDLPLMPLACGGEQGSGISPNLLPSLEWQTPSGLESRDQVEVDWARLPDLDELPSPSPPFPNLDASLTPRLPASLDGVASLAFCEQGGISEQWQAAQQQQQLEAQGQEQQERGEGLEDWNGDGRAEGMAGGEMGGSVDGSVGGQAHEAMCAVQRDAEEGGEHGGALGEPTLPERALVTQPCLLIGQSQQPQPMSAEEAASVAPMDFEAAASVAVRAELWDSPHDMSASGLEGMGREEGGGVWEELDVVVCGVNGVTRVGGGVLEGREEGRREWDLASVVRECTAARLSPTPLTATPAAAIAPLQPSPFTAPATPLPVAATAPVPTAASVPAAVIALDIPAATPPTASRAPTTATSLPPAAALASPHPLASSAPPLASPSLPLDSHQSNWAAACRAAHRRPTSSKATSSATIAAAATCADAAAASITAGGATAVAATAASITAGGAIPPSLPGRALSCSSLSLARSHGPTRPPLDRTLSGRAPAAALQTQSQGAAHTPHRGRGSSGGSFGSGGSGGQGVKEQEGVVQLLSRVATVDWEEVRRPMSRAAQSIQCHWARRRLGSVKRWGDAPVISLPDSSVSDGSLQEGASRMRGDGVGWGVGGEGEMGRVGAALSGVSDVSAGAGSCVKGV
ncbi:unnamed protein product [Closterium sp. NIES-53]